MFRHPSRKRLKRWLNGDDPGLDNHVENCSHCSVKISNTYDELPHNVDIRKALVAATRPPSGFNDRLSEAIDNRISSQGDWQLLSELFAVPIQTARIFSAEVEDFEPLRTKKD